MPNANDGTDAFSYTWKYRESGWLGTIPIPDRKKHPPPTGFTGRAAPYPSDKQITNWLTTGPHNIALRLGDVPGYVPPGEQPRGWELIGIDVDNYKEKNGAEQLRELEQRFGDLPATLCSSSRWQTDSGSYTAMYSVPAGYRFIGKAAKCIDIIQKAHRYTLVWPSVNPDADYELYRWRLPNGLILPSSEHEPERGGIPVLDDVSVLPFAWFDYLNIGIESDDPIADMTADELFEWARDTFVDINDMCTGMSNLLEKKLAELDASAESHPLLTSAHWAISRKAAEGHSGWWKAINVYSKAWRKHAGEERDAIPPPAEIQRSLIGALSKIQPGWEAVGGILASDTCANGDNVVDVDAWAPVIDEDGSIAALDYSGLGHIIGPMDKQDTEPGKYDMNDRGNGRHLVDIYTDNIKYVSSRSSWVLWSNGRWYRDSNDAEINKAFEVVARRQRAYSYTIDDEKLQAVWKRWAIRNGNASQVKNALTMARCEYVDDDEPVRLSGNEFDNNPMLLGCANGILNLATMELAPPRKQDYVTYNTNVPYIPWDSDLVHEGDLTESYQLWMNYLETFQPDEEMRLFIQKVMGHLLVGANPEKLLIFLYGEHDTGKSTMLGALRGALGDYYGTVDVGLFNRKELNPALVRAVPLRVTGMSEIDNNSMDAATIKRLTGNDEVQAEVKYSNEIFVGRPQFTTLIACNTEPEIRNPDDATRERVLILPFETPIASNQNDYGAQTAIEQHSGIAVLAWLVEGWKMYQQDGLRRKYWPERVKQLCGDVVSHFNATQTFLHETFERYTDCTDGARAFEKARKRAAAKGRAYPKLVEWNPDWVLPAFEVFELYTRWCTTNGIHHPLTHPQLTKEIGVGRPQTKTIDGKSVRCYVGLRRKDLD
jgi:P4 family phage/plasmid primase-like protien